jgi:hypothetical protein
MSIAKYELNCIFADHIVLVKVQKDSSYRHVPANTSNSFKPRLFHQHNPACRKPLPKAVDVFPRTVAQTKTEGFPASPLSKNTFSACGKSPENPLFKPFFRLLSVFYILHQGHALNVGRVYGIDVYGPF